MWISFAWTTPQFLDDKKTNTRRDWTASYIKLWQRMWDKGILIHDAYDRLPRNGGKIIGQFELTCRPYMEKLMDMPESDLKAEGGLWRSKKQFIELMGKRPEDKVCVIRFIWIPT